MGMTIEEARTELISGNPFTYKFAKALVMAIDTMRKYQKIEHIMKDVAYLDKDEYKVASIMEIIKDDN